MIRINLLPPELQRAAKTPPKFFLSLVLSVALVAVTACVYVYICFNVIVLNERVERKRAEVEHVEKNAQEVDTLLDEIADYKSREKAIISIKTNRIIWSKKLEMLCDITPPFIWIIRLEMRESDGAPAKGGGAQPGGLLALHCYSSGDEVDRMTNYRQRLKNVDEFYLRFLDESVKPGNFYSDFNNITPPEWKFVKLSEYLEPNNIRFAVKLDLRPFITKK